MRASKNRKREGANLDDGSVRRYLNASARQISKATTETQEEIDGMARLVISLAEHVVGMSRHLDELEQTSLKTEDLKAVRNDVSSLDAVSNKTIARLQFADRLNRWLSTVQKNLDALDCLLSEDSPAAEIRRRRPNLSASQQHRLFAEIAADATPDSATPERGGCNVTWLSKGPHRD